MPVPLWLEKLLTTEFFSVCRIHGDGARSECNMFCLDCNVDSFCFYCRNSKHADHQVIQIRRSSYHDVVRVSEIQKSWDISGVQTYVINSARVLFLNQRPQPKGGKAVSRVCEICGRSLLDTYRFCSLGCKEFRGAQDCQLCTEAREHLQRRGKKNRVKDPNKTSARRRQCRRRQEEERASHTGLLFGPSK